MGRNLGFAVDLRPPPPYAHEQKSPVAEKFRRLAFKGVADELEDPSDREQPKRVEPQAMKEEAGDGDRDRNENSGNAECVADAIDRMLVAAGVLRDPLLAGAVA